MAQVQNWKALLVLSVICPISMTVMCCCGLLVFTGSAISFFSYVCSTAFWAVLVSRSKRSIYMSLGLLINVFLLTYTNHPCNRPAGSPAELVTFTCAGQGLSRAVGKTSLAVADLAARRKGFMVCVAWLCQSALGPENGPPLFLACNIDTDRA